MKYPVILNDPPYGTERSYNGLRLASSLAKIEGATVKVFLIGDAASCALAGQITPNGYYNIERMLKGLAVKRAQIEEQLRKVGVAHAEIHEMGPSLEDVFVELSAKHAAERQKAA